MIIQKKSKNIAALRRLVFLLLPLILSFSTSFLLAQNSDEPSEFSRTFYLKNCTVVQQPGVVQTGQSVIIRNGLIAEVGPGLKIPFDAQVLNTDSMFVYSAFIDAMSNTGIGKPENKERPKITDPDNPPLDIAGITPQYSSTDFYKASDKSVTDMRTAGFGIAHVMPRGLMLPGKSAVFSLGEGDTDKLIVRNNVAQTAQLVATRGVAPSTVISVIAKFREYYKNAAIAGAHEEKYKLNPSGLQRPDFSKELMALYPVTKKQMPVYFNAPKVKDLHRAISLKEELGFDMVLTEVKQGWTLIDKIKNNNIGVLLSLDLPESDKKDDKKDEKNEKEKDIKGEVEADEAKTEKAKDEKKPDSKKAEPDPEKEAFDAKKEEAYKLYVSQAAEFEKKAVPFAFSFLDVKPGDIQKNVRKMIENGLSEKTALAALTTLPAKMLGISSIAGTVEKGKLANLVITNKSYFEEKSAIKFVFVDGVKYEFTEKPKKKKDENAKEEDGSLSGTWSYLVDVPGQSQTGKIMMTKDGSSYKVVMINDTNPKEEDSGADVVVDGSNLEYSMMVDMGGTQIKLEFDLKFENTTYNGSVSVGSFGSFPIKGELIDGPKRL